MTAANSGLVAQIRADRKGSLASATSSTLGLLYVMVAAGYTDMALLLSGGHAAFRMTQVMRSANILLDNHQAKSALGQEAGPKPVSDSLFRLSWMCSRMNSDLQLPQPSDALARLSGPPSQQQHQPGSSNNSSSKLTQWAKTGALVGLAGAPFTPLAFYKEEALIELLQSHPVPATAMVGVSAVVSTLLVRHAMYSVLDPSRFRKQ